MADRDAERITALLLAYGNERVRAAHGCAHRSADAMRELFVFVDECRSAGSWSNHLAWFVIGALVGAGVVLLGSG